MLLLIIITDYVSCVQTSSSLVTEHATFRCQLPSSMSSYTVVISCSEMNARRCGRHLISS